MSEEIEGGIILFKLKDWEIHTTVESPNWVEIFHYCDRKDRKNVHIKFSYQIDGDTHCPGCNAIQPDEIQGMVAMHNMDKPGRTWGRSLIEQMSIDMERIWNKQFKLMALTGNGTHE